MGYYVATPPNGAPKKFNELHHAIRFLRNHMYLPIIHFQRCDELLKQGEPRTFVYGMSQSTLEYVWDFGDNTPSQLTLRLDQ